MEVPKNQLASDTMVILLGKFPELVGSLNTTGELKMSEPYHIHKVEPSSTVEIHLPDGIVLRGPRGAPVGEFLKNLHGEARHSKGHQKNELTKAPVVGAIVNNELRELTYPIIKESDVQPVTMDAADGMRIYRRSLTFLLETAFEEQFPNTTVAIDHSVASGGYYCQVMDRAPLSKQELAGLEKRMREIVTADLPLRRIKVPLNEAIDYFKKKGHLDKVQLLVYRRKDYLTLYQLGDNCDYHHGYMVPSTGYLKWFKLTPTGEGFTLRFPRRHRPTELLPLPDYPTLLRTFWQYGDWLRRLGIHSAGSLNDAIQAGRMREIILVSEALHEQQIADIADLVTARLDQARLIVIAGPSSSGKTTFAKRLTIQLLAHGISPFPFEMDNYFVDREKTPVDERGQYDFESLQALDRVQMVNNLQQLIRGESVQLPHFNFVRGCQEPGDIVQLQTGQIVILEGIHGLNPDLFREISPELTFRIYISALTQLNLDHHNRVSTTDTRLLRRVVRDARERGYSAQDTIRRWESVRRGEKRYIFPFQENADVMFNSALVYELAVLKPLAEPLLRQVPFGSPEYIEAKRLLAFQEWFLPLESDLVPDNSILREFIGGSILHDFKLWHNHKVENGANGNPRRD
jgi:uridine kinase